MSDIVRHLKNHAFVGVATDNMDCFVKSPPQVLSGELAVDEVVVSCEVGCLKAEDPDRFFGPTLARYGLTPSNAVLIDDYAVNCQRFRDWGGHAYHYTDGAPLRAQIADCWQRRAGRHPATCSTG